MIWRQFQAVIWLRWRLSVQQWKRGGSLHALLGIILFVFVVTASASSFFVALLVGVLALPELTPDHLMLMWDVILALFLFFWVTGLVTELQKSKALSLEKLLHLPISLTGAYLLNYFSSWVSLSMLFFLPTALGLCTALVIVKGAMLLILLPLLLSFLVMITALTHQLRGWLQVLMVNKRRRRTVIAVATGVFILLVQVPNLINVAFQRSHRREGPSEYQQAVDALQEKMAQGEIDVAHYHKRRTALKLKRQEKRSQERTRKYQFVVKNATLANVYVPIGWLPIGARSAAAGNLWPGLAGTLGALLIGAASLWRSYHTTMRFYRGGFGVRAKKKRRSADRTKDVSRNFLENEFTWMPDQATAVMLAAFRSLLRGPEGKMLLLTPIFLFGFFGVMFFWGRELPIAPPVRPFLGIGVISMVMLCFAQVLCNPFGFDRSGFRSLVLSPCPRHRILLGKNLAVAPLAIGVGVVTLVALQCLVTLTVAHLLATVLQLLITYVLYCLLANVVAVYAPAAIAVGSLKPAKSNFVTVLIHLVTALVSPVAMLPGAILLGADVLMHQNGWLPGLPLYLVGSIVELGGAIWLYRQLLPVQGRLLQQRERTILDTVTMRTD